MMLYVYGIVDAHDFDAIPGEGHEAGDIVPVPCNGFAAAVSAWSACTIEATPQGVWRHERVLERLMQDHAVLPLRFGTICRNADVLRESLPYSADGFKRDLERVRGKVEIALRVTEDDSRTESPGGYAKHDCMPTLSGQNGGGAPNLPNASNSGETTGRGTAHLRAILQRHHNEMTREDDGMRLGLLLRQHLGAVLSDVVCGARADASARFLVSCLVKRGQIAAFADALDRFRAGYPQFEITSTGPWAPYSFVAAPQISIGAS
jgi:hypothetical protein